jgi:hypothetical protein
MTVKFVSNQNRNVILPNGRTLQLRKGAVVRDSVLKKLSDVQRKRYIDEVPFASKRENWTGDECKVLAEIYYVYGLNSTMVELVSRFRSFYATHTDSSIELMIQQAKNVDRNHQADGMCHLTDTFIQALVECDPQRFVA